MLDLGLVGRLPVCPAAKLKLLTVNLKVNKAIVSRLSEVLTST